MKIYDVKDKEIYIRVLPWLKEIKFSGMTYLDCLARCLSGQYKSCIGEKEGKIVGIIIYYTYEVTKCFVVGLWAKNNIEGFPELFFGKLKSQGIKVLRCSATTDKERAYQRLLSVKKVYTIYERQL